MYRRFFAQDNGPSPIKLDLTTGVALTVTKEKIPQQTKKRRITETEYD